MFLQRPATLSQAGDSLYTNRQNAPKRGRSKVFLDDVSNSGPAVRLYREGRATSLPEDHYRRRKCRNIWLLVTSPTTSTRPK